MAGTRADARTAAEPAAGADGTTAGRPGQGVAGPAVPAALAPAVSVSQASAGQVKVRAPETTSEPTDPRWASRHSAGVCDGDRSVHRRPEMPITMTGAAGPTGLRAAVAARPPAAGAPRAAVVADPIAATAASTATAAQLAATTLATHGFTRTTVSG
jgi:hypothetical protein